MGVHPWPAGLSRLRVSGLFGRAATHALRGPEIETQDQEDMALTPPPYPMRVTRADFTRLKRLAATRRSKRAEKAKALWADKIRFTGGSTFALDVTSGVKGLPTPRAPVRKPRKAPSRWKAMAAQCDALLSTLTLLRCKYQNGGICVICRARYAQCAYHLVPRSRYSVRWDISNVVPACFPCNRGEQLNRLAYREKHWVIFGGAYMSALEAKARQLAKFSVPDLEALRADLKQKMGAAKENS